MDDYMKSVANGKKRPGKADLLRHLSKKRIYRQQAIAAKCYDCNGMGELSDCDITICALFPYSPYNRKRR